MTRRTARPAKGKEGIIRAPYAIEQAMKADKAKARKESNEAASMLIEAGAVTSYQVKRARLMSAANEAAADRGDPLPFPEHIQPEEPEQEQQPEQAND